MDEEKLFELAVRLVEANIRAGQFQNGMNFDSIVRSQVAGAFEALLAVWTEISNKEDAVH